MILSQAQRDDLRRLLAEELRRACDSAAADGAATATVSRTLDERRNAVAAAAGAPGPSAHDPDGPGHDPVQDPRVGD